MEATSSSSSSSKTADGVRQTLSRVEANDTGAEVRDASDDSETALASSTRAGPSSNSSSLRMLTREEVAADTSIFSPEGAIRFPRSDGAPGYGPPNTVVPPPGAREVNYYAIFKDISEDKRYRTWSKTIASALADRFGLPKKPPKGDHWYIENFPKDYTMTEQRKGPIDAIRTDPYLFGSQGHRFRSGPEFFPHATWLLTDPALLSHRCECRYCLKLKKQGEVDQSHAMARDFYTSEKAARDPSSFEGSGRRGRPARGGDAGLGGRKTLSRRNMASENSVLIRSQVAAPKYRGLPGIPIDSAEERNSELGVMDTIQPGQCEGHRVGEVACCRLDRPIVDEEDSSKVIDIWPVEIVKRTFRVNVAQGAPQDSAPWSAEHQFNLEGRVSQIRCCEVLFLGTDEKATVDEDRLVPGIAAKMPEGLEAVELGDIGEHAWLENRTKPVLHLVGEGARPPFKQSVVAFGWQWHALTLLRSLYTTTEEFSRESLKEPAPAVVSATATNSDTSASSASASATNAGAPNRFMGGQVYGKHIDSTDEDDDFGRRRRGLLPSDGSGRQDDGGLLDNNQYWQGAFFGLEKLWVGDLVRLRLAEDDVKTMMDALAKGNDLVRAVDRTNPQLRAPYLMRIKAIYRPANVTAEDTDDKCRVAGDVYRVVEQDGPGDTPNTDGEVHKESGEASARPTFTEPIRPFHPSSAQIPSVSLYAPKPRLESSRSLPPSPYLPPGFAMQLVNRSTVDIVCSVQQLAGRLWCSLATNKSSTNASSPAAAKSSFAYDIVTARQERLKQQGGHEDSLDDVRVTLSLAGVVAGAAKAMEVDTYKGYAKDRTVAKRRAQLKGLGAMMLCFSDIDTAVEEAGKKRSRDSLEANGEDEEEDLPLASAASRRRRPLSAKELDDERLKKQSEISARNAIAEAVARAEQYSSSSSSNDNRQQQRPPQGADIPMGTAKHSSTASGPRDRTSIPVPIPEAERGSSASSSSRNAASSRFTAPSNPSAVKRSNNGPSSPTMGRNRPTPVPVATAAAAATGAAAPTHKTADAQGELPTGWQVRHSRKDPSLVYYANPEKGKTLWSRPTEND